MNPVLLTLHTHAQRGQPVALMRYPDGAAFYADRRGCIIGPRGQRGLNRKHVNAALASGELTECSTPLAGVNGRVVKMSPRCMARFQSFPDSYLLPKKTSLAVRGIGNAVPPVLYRRIAETLR